MSTHDDTHLPASTGTTQHGQGALPVEHAEHDDPIDRIWQAVALSIEMNCRYVPRAVVAAVVTDAALQRDLSRYWPGMELTLDAIENGRARGVGQMPADLLSGSDAQDVASYVAAVAGH